MACVIQSIARGQAPGLDQKGKKSGDSATDAWLAGWKPPTKVIIL